VVERLKGSRVILREPATKRMTVVPMHPGEFPRPLLQTILKQAGLSVEEFRKLL
jgi:predicted RNA binding protein YcfA (HicA-like mRNA interferase family)